MRGSGACISVRGLFFAVPAPNTSVAKSNLISQIMATTSANKILITVCLWACVWEPFLYGRTDDTHSYMGHPRRRAKPYGIQIPYVWALVPVLYGIGSRLYGIGPPPARSVQCRHNVVTMTAQCGHSVSQSDHNVSQCRHNVLKMCHNLKQFHTI